jgi:hypothetical protein
MSPDLGERELQEWIDAYGRAWETRDADAAAALFTTGARYYETPYSEPFPGSAGVRDYWAGVTADQGDITFTSRTIAVTGRTGIAHWNTKLTVVSSGTPVELDGLFVLEIGEDGLCSSLREWWHAR